MPGVKQKIESDFQRLGHLLYRHPVKVLTLLFIFVGLMVYLNSYGTVDTSASAMLRDDDPTMQDYNDFLDQFGRSELIIIAIESPDIFSDAFLSKLNAFHMELKNEVPHIRNVSSLINARSTRGEDDTLIVESLLAGWPGKSIDLAAFRQQVMTNPYYLNNIISEDGRLTAIVLELEASAADISEKDEALLDSFDEDTFIGETDDTEPRTLSEKDYRDIVAAVNQVVSRYQRPDFPLALAGLPVITDVYNRATADDMQRCMRLAMVSALFFVTLLFRRVSGIVLPALVVQSSIFSTLGLMVLFNKPITELSMVIPAFLISVGIADSVHILTIFYRHLQQGNSKEDAIAYALGHSGLAIVLTSVTTAGGLLSFSFTELTAIADMGKFSAAGVMFALLYTIFMLPPFIALFPIKPKKMPREKKTPGPMDQTLRFFADASSTHPKKILAACCVIFLISFVFLFRLTFSHNPLDYFPDTMKIKKDVLLIDDKFKGITTLEAIVDTGAENGIHEPDILNSIETLSRSLETIRTDAIFIGKVFSINDILKESNQALHDNSPAFYTIPGDRKTVAQQLFLFENSGSDDLGRIVDSQFSKTRMTIKTPNVDAVIYEDFLKDIKDRFGRVFQQKADITLTGGVVLLARTVPVALRSMAKSYIAAFFVITVLMILLMGNIKLGLLSMIPNLLPIVIVMGILGGGRIPLNLTTIMIGSIAIGLVVDDTVHFMYNYQKYYTLRKNNSEAIHETLYGTGRAMLITSLILCSGFFVLMFASLHHMVKFGFFTGVTIILALLSDFLLAPALMTLAADDKSEKKDVP